MGVWNGGIDALQGSSSFVLRCVISVVFDFLWNVKLLGFCISLTHKDSVRSIMSFFVLNSSLILWTIC